MDAARRWEEALTGWGFPEHVLEAAPEDPWRLDPEELPAGRRTDHRGADPTPADELALAALPARGSVLDVGCGPGGASRHLAARAALVTGVDQAPRMLEEFAETLSQRPGGVRGLLTGAPEVRTIPGRWPDVAAEVDPHDVVVCHNTLYNVGSDVGRFVDELTAHARRRVVLVVTDRHPLAWLTPYVEQLHGILRPSEPTSDTAVDLVRERTGATPEVRRWTVARPAPVDEDAFARLVARRCAVGADRLDEVRTALERVPPSTRTTFVAIAWQGTHDD